MRHSFNDSRMFKIKAKDLYVIMLYKKKPGTCEMQYYDWLKYEL